MTGKLLTTDVNHQLIQNKKYILNQRGWWHIQALENDKTLELILIKSNSKHFKYI